MGGEGEGTQGFIKLKTQKLNQVITVANND